MIGHVFIQKRNLWMQYQYDDSDLTIYTKNYLTQDKLTFNNINLKSKQKYLIGFDSEKNSSVIFFVNELPFADDEPLFLSSQTLNVYYYITLRADLNKIKRISFTFQELNYFYSTKYGVNCDISNNEGWNLKTIPFRNNTVTFNVNINSVEVRCSLGVSQTIEFPSQSPLTLNSRMICDFEQTDDIDFIIKLYDTLLVFFRFVCYRKSVNIKCLELCETDSNNHYRSLGTLYDLSNNIDYIESEKIISKTIEYRLIKNKISELIQLISDGNLYSEHIPKTKKDSSIINSSSFVLITAAFEWNAKNYLDICLSEKRLCVKNDILECINKIPKEKNYNAQYKKKLKFYYGLIDNVDVSLSEKIVSALEKFEEIINPFIIKLYQINELPVDTFKKMGDRLQSQRNAYAHGNISKEFDDMVILDVIILEWVNYCIVLDFVGYTCDEIFNIINSVFSRNFKNREIV